MVGELDDGTGFPYMVHDRATGVQGQTVEGVTVDPARGLAEHVGSLFSKLHDPSGEKRRSPGVSASDVCFSRAPMPSDEASPQ
jgi:hypothetical protein